MIRQIAAFIHQTLLQLLWLQCCGFEIIFSGSGSYLDLNFGSGFGSQIRLVYEKYIRNSDNVNIAKKPDCLEKFI
jgi:hypothetical protein